MVWKSATKELPPVGKPSADNDVVNQRVLPLDIDGEVYVLNECVQNLKPLSPECQARVVAYIVAKFDLSPHLIDLMTTFGHTPQKP